MIMKRFIGFSLIIIFGLILKAELQNDEEKQSFVDVLIFLACLAICIAGGWLLFGDDDEPPFDED